MKLGTAELEPFTEAASDQAHKRENTAGRNSGAENVIAPASAPIQSCKPGADDRCFEFSGRAERACHCIPCPGGGALQRQQGASCSNGSQEFAHWTILPLRGKRSGAGTHHAKAVVA